MNIAAEQVQSVIQFINLRLRYILRKFEVDRAVLFGLLARIWGLGSDEQISLAVKSLEDGNIGRAIIEY